MGIYPLNAAANAIGHLSIGLQLPREVDPYDDVLTYATEIRGPRRGVTSYSWPPAPSTTLSVPSTKSVWQIKIEAAEKPPS